MVAGVQEFGNFFQGGLAGPELSGGARLAACGPDADRTPTQCDHTGPGPSACTHPSPASLRQGPHHPPCWPLKAASQGAPPCPRNHRCTYPLFQRSALESSESFQRFPVSPPLHPSHGHLFTGHFLCARCVQNAGGKATATGGDKTSEPRELAPERGPAAHGHAHSASRAAGVGSTGGPQLKSPPASS